LGKTYKCKKRHLYFCSIFALMYAFMSWEFANKSIVGAEVKLR